MVTRTPLESWIRNRILGRAFEGPLTRNDIRRYQLERLRETVEYASAKSPFYGERFRGFSAKDIETLEDLVRLPFTTSKDLSRDALRFLCVSQSEIARVVTLWSSGTTASPKRLYFTRGDLESTMDFFHYGMSTLVEPGWRVLILLPGERTHSAGDLLARALERMSVLPVLLGPVRSVSDALDAVSRGIDCMVGAPVQVLALARSAQGPRVLEGLIKTVLLSTDHVPRAVVKALEGAWGCRVFNHYGMTETGLGGGVECSALAGYHLREADLYFEIVHPETGVPLPEGEYGEIVFTTLTRRGMPLIRYRTGDLSRFLPEPCPCGTVLKRMESVCERLGGRVFLRGGAGLSMADLDEVLFQIPDLVDFDARLQMKGGREILKITLYTEKEVKGPISDAAAETLRRSSAVPDGLETEIEAVPCGVAGSADRGTAKRNIRDER